MDGAPQYERIGQLIYGFHRAVNPKRLRDPASLSPGLAERGLALLARFEAALARATADGIDTVRDDEIAAILAEANACGRAIQDAGQ